MTEAMSTTLIPLLRRNVLCELSIISPRTLQLLSTQYHIGTRHSDLPTTIFAISVPAHRNNVSSCAVAAIAAFLSTLVKSVRQLRFPQYERS